MVDQVVGTGHAVVKVTADLDYDQTSTTTERYVSDPVNPPLADTTTKESYTGSGASVGGVLGPDNAGVPLPGAGTDTTGTTYTKDSVTRNNAVGKVVEVRKAAPGAIRKLNVGILLDTRTAGTVDPAAAADPGVLGHRHRPGPWRHHRGHPAALRRDRRRRPPTRRWPPSGTPRPRSRWCRWPRPAGSCCSCSPCSCWPSCPHASGGSSSAPRSGCSSRCSSASWRPAASEQRSLDDAEALPAIEPARPPVDPHLAQVAAARDEIGELLEAQPAEVAQLLRGWLADRRS